MRVLKPGMAKKRTKMPQVQFRVYMDVQRGENQAYPAKN